MDGYTRSLMLSLLEEVEAGSNRSLPSSNLGGSVRKLVEESQVATRRTPVFAVECDVRERPPWNSLPCAKFYSCSIDRSCRLMIPGAAAWMDSRELSRGEDHIVPYSGVGDVAGVN
jgi:hypothetical protein